MSWQTHSFLNASEVNWRSIAADDSLVLAFVLYCICKSLTQIIDSEGRGDNEVRRRQQVSKMKLDNDGDSKGLSDFAMIGEVLQEIPKICCRKICCRGTFQDVGCSRLAHML